MGNMPDKGYFYTTLTFRKKDLARYDAVTSEKGIAPGGGQWNSYKARNANMNTIFYISCGAINDVDATPNHPVEYTDNHWDSASQLGASDVEESETYAKNTHIVQDKLGTDGINIGQNQHIYPRTPGYNRDNFKAITVTNLEPGDLVETVLTEQDGGTGLPSYSGNTGYFAWQEDGGVDEKDPELDMCPKRNLIVVRLDYFESSDIVQLGVSIADQQLKFKSALRIKEIETAGADDFVNVFVYFSWDMIDEKISLGWSTLDEATDGSTDRSKDQHYGVISLAEWDLTASVNDVEDFKNRFQNKALYDIGLGNSTYINRVFSGMNPYEERGKQTQMMSGYHGFYGATELTVGDYISDKNQVLSMRNGTPRFENAVGVNWSDYSKNNNISFAATKGQVDQVYDNMIMWSELGRDGFHDLNYKLLKEPVVKIFSAPSFLKFEYSNTFVIWTRNTINRFVLKGTATGWAGSSESLIEEQLQYGLFAPKSIVKVGGELVWFSEEGVIRWSSDGMQNISGNVIDIPLSGNYLGFYCPNRNQYILHDNDTYISYAYDMTYRMWTTFKGLNIISASTLTRGDQAENFNLLLGSRGNELQQYPGENYTTEDSRIKTMDLFMDSGQIKRVKVNYNGDSAANLIYNLAYNDKDSNNIERSNTISEIQKNTWRGLGDLGRLYGRVASFEIENADEIFTILYDAYTRGSE